MPIAAAIRRIQLSGRLECPSAQENSKSENRW